MLVCLIIGDNTNPLVMIYLPEFSMVILFFSLKLVSYFWQDTLRLYK